MNRRVSWHPNKDKWLIVEGKGAGGGPACKEFLRISAHVMLHRTIPTMNRCKDENVRRQPQ